MRRSKIFQISVRLIIKTLRVINKVLSTSEKDEPDWIALVKLMGLMALNKVLLSMTKKIIHN